MLEHTGCDLLDEEQEDGTAQKSQARHYSYAKHDEVAAKAYTYSRSCT